MNLHQAERSTTLRCKSFTRQSFLTTKKPQTTIGSSNTISRNFKNIFHLHKREGGALQSYISSTHHYICVGRSVSLCFGVYTRTWHLTSTLIKYLTGIRELFRHTQNDSLKCGISELFLQHQFFFVAPSETTLRNACFL